MEQNFLRLYEVAGKPVLIGSDMHYPVEGGRGFGGEGCPFNSTQASVDDLVGNLNRQIGEFGGQLVVIGGDLFYAQKPDVGGKYVAEGRDTSREVSEVISRIAGGNPNKTVLFTPGNHDLRRERMSDDSWADFKFEGSNIIAPNGREPIVDTVGGLRLATGDLGYDLDGFTPFELLGITREEVLEEFAGLPDSVSLLRGVDSLPLYREMVKRLASVITPDVDLVATHALSDSSLVTYRVAEMTVELQRLKAAGLPITCNPAEDDKKASSRGLTGERYRGYWNRKSAVMGSSVLDPAFGANPKDGLVLAYGHNHRGSETNSMVNDRPVRFITNQQMFGNLRA